MSFQAALDFETLLIANFDFNNETNLVGNPTIRLFTDTLPTGFPTDGEVVIDDERLDTTEEFINHRNEPYSFLVMVSYTGTTAVTKEIVSEIDRVLRDNNKALLGTKEYHIKVASYKWWEQLAPTKQIELTISMTKEMVDL